MKRSLICTLAILIGVAIGASVAWNLVVVLATVAVLISPLAVWATLRYPGVVLALYGLIPFYKGALDPVLPVDLTALLAALNAITAIAVVRDLLVGALPRAQMRSLLVWSGLAVLVVAGVAWAPDAALARSAAIDFVLLAAIPLLAGARVARSPDGLTQFVLTCFVLGAVSTVVGISQFGSLGAYDRLTALGTNTIGTGRSVLLVPLLTATWLWPSRHSLRWLGLGLTPFALLVALGAGARGPVVAAGVTLAVVLLVRASKSVARTLAVLTGMVLVVVLPRPDFVTQLLPQASLRRFDLLTNLFASNSGGLNEAGSSVEVRLAAYRLAQQQFADHPFTGVGTAGFAAEASQIPGMLDLRYPHNLLLQSAAEYGVIGLIILTVMLFSALRRTFAGAATILENAVGALFLFMVVGALTSSGMLDNRLLWALALLCLFLPPLPVRQMHQVGHLATHPSASPVSLTHSTPPTVPSS